MSIIAIFEILKKAFSVLTNKWTYFILTIVISGLVIVLLIVDIKKKDKTIINLSTEITNLTISNVFYQNEILDREDEIRELNIYNNSLSKINKTVIYMMPKDDIIAYDSISNDFMETQVK